MPYSNPCDSAKDEYQGDGTTVLFSVTFEYAEQSDVKVYLWNDNQYELTTDWTWANATQIQFNTAPAVPSNPATINNVRIVRETSIEPLSAQFYPGASIKAKDLNDNFEQLKFAVEENRCIADSDYWKKYEGTVHSNETWSSSDNLIATTAAMDARFQDELSETITSAETWTGDDDTIATTAAIDNRIDTAITNDIGTDGTGITVTDDGDGTITLGLGVGSIDIDRIKDEDIITYAEQNAGSPSWNSDSRIPTTYAAAKRFDTIVSDTTPTGSDWEVGKTWLQQAPDNTLSIWNGTGWIGVASGGTFLTQPTVIYVDAANGNDSFDGHRIINPKRTIKNAVASANAGDIVYVVPGVYQETLPIDITVSNLSIVGQSIRSCFIHPTAATETQTMFRCNSGTYITGFTFAGLKASGTRGGNPIDSDSTYGLPTNQGWVAGFYPGCVVKKSPYIQNCTNFADSGIDNNSFDPNNFQGTGGDLTSAPTGGGILVDGSLPSASSPLRSFVVDSFTQICLDGPGCLVANNGYAQLVSFFGTFCHYHTKALSGGQVNLTNSTTDFGRYGLIADGKSSSAIFTATANGAATQGDITFAINQPVDNWFGSATRPLDNMMVQVGSDIYPILSSSPNGLGWNITISNPNPSNRAENLGLTNSHTNGAAVSFYLRSLVSTSGHTFEYAGSGTDYTALPENGGVANELNQTININEGRVWQSSTDQNGKFKVGDTFEVDQKTGVVTISVAASSGVQKTAATGSAIIPTGSTGQRDVSPAAGYFRFNTTDGSFEGYDGTAWGSVGGATPAGVSGSIQINDGAGNLGDVTDFKWDTANTELDIPGDINLDDGGTYTTTIQSITATADRFISFPDATGVVALVQGINGAVQFNNAGVSGGGNLGYSSTAGTFGYISGSGTVTQTTNKSTGVTLNAPCGRITMNGAALSADTTVTFTLTNSSIGANDLLVLNHVSGGTAGSYLLNAQAAAGSASINVRNITAGSLSEAIVIGFAIIKS